MSTFEEKKQFAAARSRMLLPARKKRTKKPSQRKQPLKKGSTKEDLTKVRFGVCARKNEEGALIPYLTAWSPYHSSEPAPNNPYQLCDKASNKDGKNKVMVGYNPATRELRFFPSIPDQAPSIVPSVEVPMILDTRRHAEGKRYYHWHIPLDGVPFRLSEKAMEAFLSGERWKATVPVACPDSEEFRMQLPDFIEFCPQEKE